MKRLLILILCLLVVFQCLSCISQADYDLLETDNETLKQEKEELEKQVGHLEYMVKILSTPDPADPVLVDAKDALSDIKVTLYEPNSADGVDIRIDIFNPSAQTIKYISFLVTPFNAVGDKVQCEISRESTLKLTLTGPGEPRDAMAGLWEAEWYNPTIDSCKLSEIYIEYMDGSSLDIPENILSAIGVVYERADSKY